MPVVIFFACLPSSPEGYARQVILIKNPHFWMDAIYVSELKFITVYEEKKGTEQILCLFYAQIVPAKEVTVRAPPEYLL
jgi:hypothetical protein